MNYYPANARGGANHGWLKTSHSFSFADFYDKNRMGYSALRVINEDYVDADTGFPTHGHRDMEIITIVLSGAVAHKDSMDNEAMVKPGEIQRMSAGSGVRHSEENPLNEKLHLYQIWIQPDKEGYKPSYEQKSFQESYDKYDWTLVVSNTGRQGSLKMNQNADMWIGSFKKSPEIKKTLAEKRNFWLQVMTGEVVCDGKTLKAGDALFFGDEKELALKGHADSQVLLFDLP